MSMDKSAIEQIQKTSGIPQLIEQITGFEIPLALVPREDGRFEITDLEKYQEHLDRYRAVFSTDSIPDFIKYAKDYDVEGALCFVNKDNMTARTIFDVGSTENPLHRLHKANLELVKTAAYIALEKFNQQGLDPRRMVEFVEDWRDNMSQFVSTTGEEVQIAKAIDSFRTIKIQNTKTSQVDHEDFGAQASAMEQIELSNRDVQVKSILFKCVPYDGLQERVFELRISIEPESMSIKYRILQLEAIQEEMAQEFKNLIVDELKDEQVVTYIGSFNS